MRFELSGYRIPRRMTIALAGAAMALCALTPASQASQGSSSAAKSACSYPNATQVFAQSGDDAYYELAPDGGFEAGASGWTLAGPAALVEGNESQHLNGGEDATSLSLSTGATATSPRFCVDATTPVFRFMALNSGDDHAKLRVTVTYETPKGPKTRITELRAGDAWAATEPLQLDTDGEAERAARISFTPSDGSGKWLLDDLYIDPFARR